MRRNWYKNEKYCWFPFLDLENWECLNWDYVFFSEKETTEGEICRLDYDFEESPYAIFEWTGWYDVIVNRYIDELLDGYTFEYKFDGGLSRIIIKIKDTDGKIFDVVYFWMVPAGDESDWIWKGENKHEDEMPDESILLTEEEREDERENNAWIRGTFSSAQEFEQWAEGTMED